MSLISTPVEDVFTFFSVLAYAYFPLPVSISESKMSMPFLKPGASSEFKAEIVSLGSLVTNYVGFHSSYDSFLMRLGVP